MTRRRNSRKYRRKRQKLYAAALTFILFVLLFVAIFIVALQGLLSLRNIKTEDTIEEESNESLDVLYLTHPLKIDRSESAVYDARYIEISDSDIDLIAKLLWFEARGECDDCKRRVVSVVVNRMTTSGLSAYDVIYSNNQFEPACNISESNIPEEDLIKMREIVNEVVKDGPTVPEYVTYFRADHFHNFKDQVPYISCCNTYVSYDYNMYVEHMNK